MDLPTIEDARRLAESFRASLPTHVAGASLSLKSRTPFKALVLREALFHRVSSLTDGAISEFDSGRWLAATILVRAIVETTAVLFALNHRVVQALSQKADDDLTEFLRRTMVSSRTEPSLPQAINILSLIELVEKKFHGFRKQYEQMSEYAHPNWCGVLGAFTETDYETHTATFKAFEPTDTRIHIAGLMFVLVVAESVYNEGATQIGRLNQAFESGEIGYSA